MRLPVAAPKWMLMAQTPLRACSESVSEVFRLPETIPDIMRALRPASQSNFASLTALLAPRSKVNVH